VGPHIEHSGWILLRTNKKKQLNDRNEKMEIKGERKRGKIK
jgi:hypothetical protein